VDGGDGVLVMATERDGPGAEAGIKAGDVIVAFNGQQVPGPAALVLLLTRADVGIEVPLQIVREGRRLTLPVRIGRRPR
jgi:serine protease Do